MGKRVCPWWLGWLLASPVRRWLQGDPEQLLRPYVREGMTVLEPGPGMGFFTLPLARMVGPKGWVVAVDVQAQMLNGLRRRLAKAALTDRVDVRLARSESMGLADLAASADFTLAFAVVHEFPNAERFFSEVGQACKPGGIVFFAEPSGHVKPAEFEVELQAAAKAGLASTDRLTVRRSTAVLLRKS
jgi:ubiquinone/menaquinone biosynthesis C-methylase UbiE